MRTSAGPISPWLYDKLGVILPLLAVVYAALLLHREFAEFRGWVIDDSFITYIYSRNLAQGHGPVYSPSLPHAEGCTSVLWMVVMAIPHLPFINADALSFARAVSGICVVGAGIVLAATAWQLCRELRAGSRRIVSAAAGLVPFVFEPLVKNGMSGMETAFCALLMCVFCCLTVAQHSRPNVVALGVAGLLCGLARPEANLMVVVSLATLVVLRDRSFRLESIRLLLVSYVLPAGLYFVWRWHFYGLPLPLPFYIKGIEFRDFPDSKQYGERLPGLPYVMRFVSELSVAYWAFTAVVMAVSWKRVLPAFLGCVAVVFYFTTVKPIMAFDMRYLAPYACFLLSLPVIGMGSAGMLLKGLNPPFGLIASILRAVGILVALNSASFSASPVPGSAFPAIDQGHIQLGQALGRLSSPDAHALIAMGDAGETPYFSGWQCLDTDGLNDRWIATHGYGPGYTQYVLRHRPDVIACLSTDATKWVGYDDTMTGLFNAALADHYRIVGVKNCGPNYHLFILANALSPIGQRVMSDLRLPVTIHSRS